MTRRRVRKPAWIDGRSVNGWDTETENGRPFIVSIAWDSGPTIAVENSGTVIPPKKLFQLLTHRKARGAINVWYNLDFDANVILAHLPLENLYEISLTTRTEWQGYEITYIPRKVLTIKDPHKHVIHHYDAAQFFFTNLENAAQEWLGKGKEKETIDASRFDSLSYRVEHWDEIVRYAKVDAELVRDLFRTFSETAESYGIPCGRPYSTGYLGEQSMNVVFSTGTKSKKPGFSYSSMQALSEKAYFGGRFEIVRRGEVGSVKTYDINSAYPHILQSLPDPSTLKWSRFQNPSIDDIRGYDYGLIDVVVSGSSSILQPFPHRDSSGRITFPRHTGTRIQTTLHEFRYAVQAGLIDSLDIRDVWVGRTGPHTRYPFRFLNDLYNQRQSLKEEGRTQAQHCLKIVINSVYGKLCQRTERKKLVDGCSHPDFFPLDGLPSDIQDWLLREGKELERYTRPGNYYNPFLACHVTGLTRLALLRAIIDNSLIDKTIMLATDSIMVEESAKFGPILSSDLGAWDLETKGKAFVAGSGIYEILTDSGERISKSRGYEGRLFKIDFEEGLREAAREAGEDPITISPTRPLKISQAIWQGYDIDQVGRFLEWDKKISAGMDRKRLWPRGDTVTWNQLLESSETSTPLTFSQPGMSHETPI